MRYRHPRRNGHGELVCPYDGTVLDVTPDEAWCDRCSASWWLDELDGVA